MKPKEQMLRTLEQFSTAMLAALGYLPAAGLVLAAGARLASAGVGRGGSAFAWAPPGPGGRPCPRGGGGGRCGGRRGGARWCLLCAGRRWPWRAAWPTTG